MAEKTVTLYPSPQFPQKQDKPKVPLAWAISHFQQLLGTIPSESRANADVTGWDKLAVKYTKTLSQAEEDDLARKQARQIVKAAADAGLGLTPAETAEVLALLKQM
jgi:hypothetical protein